MKTKMTPKRIAVIVVVLLVAVAGWQMLKPKAELLSYQRAIPLTLMDLRTTVDVTGNVESADSVSVYSAVSQKVLEIAVEVGDTVKKGDLLCRMDAASILSNITAKQVSIEKSSQSNELAVKDAKTDLYYAEWYLEHDQNAEILAAEKAVSDAERAVQETGATLSAARRTYREARGDNEVVDGGDEPAHMDAELRNLRNAVTSAELQREAAEANLAAAEQRLKRAQWDANAQLNAAKDNLTKAEIGSDMTTEYIALEQLQKDLANCTITAPTDGTVTAVYASEGDDAKGLMFVIENTQDLVVKTTIKEFDINSVAPGMAVQIKSEATGDESYQGELLSIDPASRKDTAGNTVTGSTAEYAATVRVTSADTGLRIGMNVRLNIIVAEKPGKMAVLYDCVTTDAEGNSIVYVARVQEDGSYIAEAVPVQTGMETDLYMEVSGPALVEGDLILQDVLSLFDGMPVVLAPDIADPAAAGGGMGRGGVAVGGARVVVATGG